MIDIDGSFLEGGGQIIRTAVGLSAVTGKPCRIFNIRKGRPNPGLQPQHLKGIEAVARLCDADVLNLKPSSTEICFSPKKISSESLKIDIGTAGAATLVLQSLLIPAIQSERPMEFEISGGTNVPWSPNIEYFENIFSRFLSIMGVDVKTEVKKYGFYPKGGGLVKVFVNPSRLKPLSLREQGKYLRTDIFSIASRDLEKANVAERQIQGAEKTLKTTYQIKKYVETLSPGCSVHMHSHYSNTILGAGFLGEKGLKAELVGEKCASLLKKQSDSRACLDEWMADQILPYIALCEKPSDVTVSKLTGHAKTNIWVIKQFLDADFKTENLGSCFLIKCLPKRGIFSE